MIIDFILAGLVFYFALPLIAGYSAFCYGRSFWAWFLISSILPLLGYLILVAVIFWDERKSKTEQLTRKEEAESDRLVKELLKNLNQTKVGEDSWNAR